MRTVKYYEYFRPEGSAYNVPYEKREVGEAIFHQFGVDHAETENGPANYSVAIIELPTGVIESVPVYMITFVEPLPCKQHSAQK